MSDGQKVRELYGENDFQRLIQEATAKADTQWEDSFVDDMKERYRRFHGEMFISEKQLDILERIANRS